MPKKTYLEEQFVSEFDFSIKINSEEENDFFYIRNKISQINYKNYSARPNSIQRDMEFGNIPYLIVKTNFDRHFRFLGEGKAYLTNYTEKEGSFNIEFTMLIFESAIMYGGVRQTIDYFVEDLENIFTTSLPKDFKTKLTYKKKRNFKKSDHSIEQHLISLLKPIERNIFINRAMIGLLIFILILGITYIINSNDHENYVTKEEFKSNIKKELTNPLKDTKIQVYINERANDTVK